MVKKITKYKKYIISIMLISLLAIFFANIKYLLPKKYEELPEVRLRKIKSSKSFAIMVPNETGDGYKEYKSEDGTWPGEKYTFKEAKCVDNNGVLVENAITFESATKTAILETDKTVSCTLYFAEKVNPTNFFRKYDPNNVISIDLVGDMYRYQGVGVESAVDDTHKLVDNNYICFGTDNQEECLGNEEKYMYRIIGITEDGQLKLIKAMPIVDSGSSLFEFSWYDSDNGDYGWGNTTLYRRLNGISNGNDHSENGDSNIFIGTKEYPSSYDYLLKDSIWYNKIENHSWLYGNIGKYEESVVVPPNPPVPGFNYGLGSGASVDGLTVYEVESGKESSIYIYCVTGVTCGMTVVTWSKTVDNVKIGLMYLSDYYLAYDNERNWYENYDTTNWLYFNTESENYGYAEWFMSATGWDGNRVPGLWDILYDGSIEESNYVFPSSVRPTFYLKADVKIKEDGNGTQTNPFTIEI